MKALDRIKMIEQVCTCHTEEGCHACSSYTFLLKAFQVMREIAIEFGGEWLDEEFEERMSK